MKNLVFWILFYTAIMALSQIFLKLGTNQVGTFKISEGKDVFLLGLQILKNPLLLSGIVLLTFSFFLWLYILSWFNLGLVFPLTALVYLFVALLSYFFLGERPSLFNYFGVILIAAGVFFLLHK